MKYICIILIFFVISCNRYGIDFEIHNDDVRTIDSIIISNGFNISKSLSLKPQEETLVFLDFKENNTHSDGNFFIKYYINAEQKLKTFGYYSNGIPSTDKVIIEIKKDTLLIKEKFD
ncbi:hypothetical protein D3C80_1556940 [compost metagenome]